MDKISFNIKKSNTISPSINSKGNIRADLRNPDKVYVKELFFSNRFEFPAVGEGDKLYIARDEHMSYYFDEDSMTYVAVGLQLEDIEIVNGGNANAE